MIALPAGSGTATHRDSGESMHILLALLSGLGGVIWAIYYLDRTGFDFASLNPFLWMRRAHWKRQYEKDPLFSLNSPLEVACVLLLGVAKEAGEITSDERAAIKALMMSELKRPQREADDLYQASAFLLRDHESIVGKVGRIVEDSRSRFTPEQVDSIESLLESVARTGRAPTERQLAVIDEFREEFRGAAVTAGTWN